MKRGSALSLLMIAVGLFSETLHAINPVLVTNVLPNNGFGSLVISGKYLYSVGDALRIFDISNPANPIQLGATNLSGGGSGLVVSGNHAYVLEGSLLAYEGANLSVFDISVAANPLKVNEILGSAFSGIAISNNYVYCGLDDGAGFYLWVYDISNPVTPMYVAHIRSDLITALVVQGSFAYMFNADTGLFVCDVSDPLPFAIPQQNQAVSGIDFPLGIVGGGDIAVQDKVALLAANTNGVFICDVSNPTNSILLAHVVVAANDAPVVATSLTVSGNYAYAASGSQISILDISNPTNSTVVFHDYGAFTLGYEQSHTVAVSGNYFYIGTVQGLEVYSLGIEPPLLTITSTPTNLLLSWPTPTGAFAVQQNPDLNSSNWTTLTNIPVVVGINNQVTIPKQEKRMFYRLISQ